MTIAKFINRIWTCSLMLFLLFTLLIIDSRQSVCYCQTVTDSQIESKEVSQRVQSEKPINKNDTSTVKSEAKSEAEDISPKTASGGGSLYLVRKVYLKDEPNIHCAGINDYITVVVDSLGNLVDLANKNQKQIILFIDDYPIKGQYYYYDINKQEIYYKLERNDSSRLSWKYILSKPDFFRNNKLVSISIGIDNAKPIPTEVKNFEFIIFNTYWLLLSFLLIIILGVFIYFLGRNTGMLREPFSKPTGETAYDSESKPRYRLKWIFRISDKDTISRPYSLALTQMIIWYYLVISSCILLFLITHEFPVITGSVLTLIGISSLTGLGSTVINFNKRSSQIEKKASLEAEREVIKRRIDEIKALLPKAAEPLNVVERQLEKEYEEKSVRLEEINKEIPKYSTDSNIYMTRGFWYDLVSDSTGVSLYRFQIFVWTALLGVYFLISVWSTLTMPQFDETLLALMGISSGTYIGFKIPEQKI